MNTVLRRSGYDERSCIRPLGPYARIVDGAPRRGFSDRGHCDGGVFKNRSTVEKAGRFTNICEFRTRSVVGMPEAHNIALKFPA